MKFNDKEIGIKTLERLVGVKAVYSGLPTFSYTIGDYTIDRDGKLTCPDALKLKAIERRIADEGIDADGIPHLDGSSAADSPKAVRNLINMIRSRQNALNHSVGYKAFDVSETLVQAIHDRTLSLEAMLQIVRDHSPTGLTVLKGKLAITGLPDTDVYVHINNARDDNVCTVRTRGYTRKKL